MTKHSLFIGLAALSLPAVCRSDNSSMAPTPTFHTSAQMVLVPVTVTDRYGKTVSGLRAQDFTILDEQKPQPILSFGTEDSPCSVGLVLDVSGSMRNLLSGSKDVIRSFLGTTNPEDEFLLLTVSTQPNAVSGFTQDIERLEKDIQLTRPGGQTALIDTVYLGLIRMRQARRPRRALLIISDGVDNHSRYSKPELMRVALEADVQVYTIIVDNPSATASGVPFRPSLIKKPGDRAADRQGPRMLEELSEKTGGLHYLVRKDAEAKEAVIKAGEAIRNEYVIGYQPPVPAAAGKWHRVRVKLDVPKVNVYARSGYYAR